MDTEILYYKKFKGIEKPLDYVNWAFSMLENEISTTSLNILASLREPLNIFEVEDYFERALDELSMKEPSYEQCAKYHIRYLLRQIIDDKNNAMNFAYEIYEVVRELFTNEELETWYEISEMIDDFRYGDNIKKLTQDFLITIIVQEAKKQLGSKFLK
ncbi:hypothetical protein AWH56_018800 [Anaerobacillus isosaccharinicus]|uniref:Uncharacterized protein n=1 Tax=Anaerobacillus isosaccharinicus TaxID=1532552 RepID=A0A1S2L436_9BACI|nr:hypothetical protein [Anaerobacillus isosaccharinicus]MBA5587044.1 hypothetical protein [Anaerobacillus isosaccharinicus]QOY34757.1 hypothetical protein AWH56_018800 [Anaerobacillus isosaccharinicus]